MYLQSHLCTWYTHFSNFEWKIPEKNYIMHYFLTATRTFCCPTLLGDDGCKCNEAAFNFCKFVRFRSKAMEDVFGSTNIGFTFTVYIFGSLFSVTTFTGLTLLSCYLLNIFTGSTFDCSFIETHLMAQNFYLVIYWLYLLALHDWLLIHLFYQWYNNQCATGTINIHTIRHPTSLFWVRKRRFLIIIIIIFTVSTLWLLICYP